MSTTICEPATAVCRTPPSATASAGSGTGCEGGAENGLRRLFPAAFVVAAAGPRRAPVHAAAEIESHLAGFAHRGGDAGLLLGGEVGRRRLAGLQIDRFDGAALDRLVPDRNRVGAGVLVRRFEAGAGLYVVVGDRRAGPRQQQRDGEQHSHRASPSAI